MGPASSITTFSPPSVNTLAAAPPAAPEPMMHTSYTFPVRMISNIDGSPPPLRNPWKNAVLISSAPRIKQHTTYWGRIVYQDGVPAGLRQSPGHSVPPELWIYRPRRNPSPPRRAKRGAPSALRSPLSPWERAVIFDFYPSPLGRGGTARRWVRGLFHPPSDFDGTLGVPVVS